VISRPAIGRLLRDAAWAPLGVVLLHVVAAHFLGHEPYVDPVMHFLGGAAIAFFLRRAAEIGRPLVGEPSPLGLDLMAFGLAVVAGLVWEFGEFLSDVFLGSHAHTSVGNTLRDLLLDLLGAAGLLLALGAITPGSRGSGRPGRGGGGDFPRLGRT